MHSAFALRDGAPAIRNTFVLAVLAIVWFHANVLRAQTRQGEAKDPGLREKFDIVKNYKPQLSDADKLPIQPKKEEVDEEAISLDYDIEVRPAAAPRQNAAPRAARGGEQTRETALYHHQLRMGGGNLGTFVGDYHYASRRNRDFLFTGRLKHRSGNGPVDDLSSFSRNEAGVLGRKLFEGFGLKAGIDYQRRVVHHYGFDEDFYPETPDFSANDLEHRYNRFDVSVGLFSIDPKPDQKSLRWEGDLAYRRFADNRASSENDFHLETQLAAPLAEGMLEAGFQWRAVSYTFDSLEAFTRNIPSLGLAYRRSQEPLRWKAGFQTALSIAEEETEFFIYPDLEVEYLLNGTQLMAFAGLKGGLQPQRFSVLAEENPFLAARPLNLANTSEALRAEAGIKGSVADEWSYELRTAYHVYQDLPFFLNDARDGRTFQTRYDDAGRFQVLASIVYEAPKLFDFYLRPEINTYAPDSLPEASHYPALRIASGATYYFADKFSLGLDLLALGGREALVAGTGESVGLDGFLDVGLRGNYYFSRYFGAFVQFHNLTGNEYQYWNQYPVRGFQALGGLRFRY
jgi:hypothetical protein